MTEHIKAAIAYLADAEGAMNRAIGALTPNWQLHARLHSESISIGNRITDLINDIQEKYGEKGEEDGH